MIRRPVLVFLGLLAVLAGAVAARAEPRPELPLTGEERRFLADHPVLRLGVASAMAPFQSVVTGPDGKRRIVGLAADYLAYLAEQLGVAFAPRLDISLSRALDLAQTGEIDLFPCLTRTPQRETYLHFTRPYVVLPFVLVTRREPGAPGAVADLAGKTLAVAPIYYPYDRLRHAPSGPGIRYLFVQNAQRALEAVSRGQADATILNLALVTVGLAKGGLDNLRLAAPLAWEQSALSMATPHPVLAGILQKALDAMPKATGEDLLGKALTPPPRPVPRGVPPGVTVAVGGLVGLVLLAGWWWLSRRRLQDRQRRLERELRHHRDLLQALFDATSDAIIVLDDQLRVVMSNRIGAARFGLDLTGMIGRAILDLTDPPVAEARRQRYAEALASGRAVRFTDTRAGRVYDNILHPLRLDPGEPGRLAVYARDITEHLAAESALRESQERLDKVFRLIPVVVTLSTLPEGRYLDVNEAFTAITGFTREQALGRNTTDLGMWLHRGDHDHLYAILERDGQIRNLEFNLRLADGRVGTALLSGTTIEAFGQSCLLSVVVDITGRKTMEEALRLAKDSAEAANRAKSRFLSTMSHEIRTPMNTILGMVDVLQGTELTGRQREFLRTLEVAGEALMGLLADILELARIESGALDLVRVAYDPAEVVRQTVAILRPQAESKGLAVNAEVAPDLPGEAVGDPGRLRQILINLLGNAIKFTPRGGVGLDLALATGPSGHAELRYRVTDTGIGIAADKLGAIFEPFTQLDSSTTRGFGGSGLGLAISRLLAEGMGGRLWVESQPGEGSTFYCAVPLASRSLPDPGAKGLAALWPAKPPEPPGLPGPTRLLVVEDSEPNRQLYQVFLEGQPVGARFAATGTQALSLARAETFDAMVIDLRLPDIDGLTVISEIRRREAADGRPPTPILVVTAQVFREENGQAFEAGADALLAKPVQKARFLDVLGGLLRRKSPDAGSDAWTTPPVRD